MKRRVYAVVSAEYYVDLDIDDDEQMTADPDGEMADGESAERAVIESMGDERQYVPIFGPNIESATVFRESVTVTIQGES